MSSPPRRRSRRLTPDLLAAADQWFLAHGRTYFVPEVRGRVRDGLRPRRLVPLAALVLLVAAAAGALLAWVTGQVSTAPAVLVSLGVASAAVYALTVLRAGPIVTWALGRTFGSLRSLLPMNDPRAAAAAGVRHLPLHQCRGVAALGLAEHRAPCGWWCCCSSSWRSGSCWCVCPRRSTSSTTRSTRHSCARACAGTPLEEACEEVLDEGGAAEAVALAQVSGFERWNLVIVLVVIQAVQVLLLAATVLVFFLVFGSLTMSEPAQPAWTGLEATDLRQLPGLSNVSVPLFQVSLFLAAFSSLYLTVSTVTDETYREHFFASVMSELQTAFGMRAVYLVLRTRRSP